MQLEWPTGKKFNIPSLSTTSGGKRRVAKALLMMLENSWLKQHQQKLILNSLQLRAVCNNTVSYSWCNVKFLLFQKQIMRQFIRSLWELFPAHIFKMMGPDCEKKNTAQQFNNLVKTSNSQLCEIPISAYDGLCCSFSKIKKKKHNSNIMASLTEL